MFLKSRISDHPKYINWTLYCCYALIIPSLEFDIAYITSLSVY